MKKVAFISLGCAKNLVNTEQMMALCQEAGHQVSGDPQCADVAVVNTCGFIDAAKSEAISQILELASLKKEGQLGKIIVAGCLSQRYSQDIFTELPEVDGVLGTGSYTDVVEAVDIVSANQRASFFRDIHHTDDDGQRILTTPKYSTYLKIAEGCSNGCGFCIIPKLRGKYRSRDPQHLLEEAKTLKDQGVQELILIAQDCARYGSDRQDGSSLATLVDQLAQLDFHWIRLHYLYPEAITPELLEVMTQRKNILPYFDIPIQHASDRLLASMGRRSTRKELSALLARIRQVFPQAVFRTSLICGLPGETEEDFQELCDFLQEERLQRAGVFQYSREEGTRAAQMEEQIPEDLAAHRVELLVDLQSRIMDDYYDNLLGDSTEVLCEGYDPEAAAFVGRTYADSPEIDGRVLFESPHLVTAGTFVQVHLTHCQDGDLWGELEED